MSRLDASFPNQNSDEGIPRNHPRTPEALSETELCRKFPGRSSSLRIQSYGSFNKKSWNHQEVHFSMLHHFVAGNGSPEKRPTPRWTLLPPSSAAPDSHPGNLSAKPLQRARHKGGCARCRTRPRWEVPLVLKTWHSSKLWAWLGLFLWIYIVWYMIYDI